MAVFQKIDLSWNGKDFSVPADRVMGAICAVEEVSTYSDLFVMLNGKPSLSKLARAYGVLLRYAGAQVDDEEIYNGLFTPGEMAKKVSTAINTLLGIMTPPNAIAKNGDASEGNPNGATKSAPSGSSKARTRRQ